MIDVVRLGLSAGLSFDAALELYCTGRESALARRMGEAMLAWRMGVSTREEALLAAARDSGVRALETFATVSSQAIELAVLRLQRRWLVRAVRSGRLIVLLWSARLSACR